MKAVTSISHKSDMDPAEPATQFLLVTYQRKTISVLSQARLLCCINLIRELPEYSRVIIFCEQMEQAEEIYRMIGRTMGPIAGLYHSAISREARSRVMSQFRERSIRVLCSCKCLDEGIDVPDADIGIVISSSAISRQRIQRLGRIIRQSPDKHAACLYYIYIRESTDEVFYLDKLDTRNIFNLRYYTLENAFANELYEYAARELLEDLNVKIAHPEEASSMRKEEIPMQEEKIQQKEEKLSAKDDELQLKEKESRAKVLAEMRSCLIEGLVRPDYLLPPAIQTVLMDKATTTHQKNYWYTMKLIGKHFRP